MTPIELIDELAEEYKRLFRDYLYKNPLGEDVPISVYKHALPINETDDEADPVPWIIVRLNSGEDKGTGDSVNTVKLVTIICVWDDSLDSQGYRGVLNIIQKIYQRFATSPNLNGKAAFKGEFDWVLQEDDYYPYYFGACSLEFNIAAIRREDPYS